MLHKYALFLFSFLIANLAFAQDKAVLDETSDYNKHELTGALVIHTNGWGVNFRYGKYTSGFTKRVWEFELVGMKHPKEIKSFNPFEDNVRGYIYGKMNTMTVFRPSLGFHKKFIDKQSLKGVSIGRLFHIGPSLAFAKPVYLNIQEPDDNRIFRLVKRRYDPDQHFPDNIYGRASFVNGLDQLRLYPGVFSKFAYHFEYANERDVVKAIEAGITADIYLEKVPIMAFTENRQAYFTLYVSILYGAKKRKT